MNVHILTLATLIGDSLSEGRSVTLPAMTIRNLRILLTAIKGIVDQTSKA